MSFVIVLRFVIRIVGCILLLGVGCIVWCSGGFLVIIGFFIFLWGFRWFWWWFW